MTTINQLAEELVSLVKTVSDFSGKSFYVFNSDDFEQVAAMSGFPAAGITYEGITPNDGNKVDGQVKLKSAALVRVIFSVIVGVNYNYGAPTDTKQSATALLDAIRPVILGYKGVNTRPWEYRGESPLESELDGVILYAQMWDTVIPVVSN